MNIWEMNIWNISGYLSDMRDDPIYWKKINDGKFGSFELYDGGILWSLTIYRKDDFVNREMFIIHLN